MDKICSVCGVKKDVSEFRFRKDKNAYYTYCRACENAKNKKYKADNKDKVSDYNTKYMKDYNKEYYQENKEALLEYQEEYRENNSEKIKRRNKTYYSNNKEKILKRVRKYADTRRDSDPVFRLKESVSANIRLCIKKNNQPFAKYLPYTIQELKEHLEKQFESWMTWQNYGTYRLDIWNDNDPATWTWQLDHIVPHSKFQYTSMEDQAFKDCWALTNLRPYSAKQNVIEGNHRSSNKAI